MRVAVTGASGFIGRHVIPALLNANHDVIAITRKPKLFPLDSSQFEIVEYDIGKPDDNCYDRLQKPDVLIHLAWGGLPNYTSLHHFETELPRQYTFLQGMIYGGLSHLMVSGTCMEYGMQSGCLSESTPANPSNPYGFAKDTLRRQLEFIRQISPFELTWARLFYIYGGDQSPHSLYMQLMQAVKRGDGYFNMSGGEQLRDYLHVDAVSAYLVKLMELNQGAGIINICSGSPESVKNIVNNWIQENDWSIKTNLGYYPYPDHEPMEFWGDPSYLNRRLTTSTLSLVEGQKNESRA